MTALPVSELSTEKEPVDFAIFRSVFSGGNRGLSFFEEAIRLNSQTRNTMTIIIIADTPIPLMIQFAFCWSHSDMGSV